MSDNVVVTLRVPRDLARLLDQLPNRSDFIRTAIEAQLDVVCPCCSGSGRVSRDERRQFIAMTLERR